MGLPKGTNSGNHGIRGRSGRKNAALELENFKNEDYLFFLPQNLEKLERRIASGRYSIREKMLLMELEGDTKLILAHFNKVVPNPSHVLPENPEPQNDPDWWRNILNKRVEAQPQTMQIFKELREAGKL